jgi:hypothetical protein
LWQVAPLHIVAGPAQQRVNHERVLHVDDHANRGIDLRERFDGEYGVKERAAAAAVRFGNFDAITPKSNSLSMRPGTTCASRPFAARAAAPLGRRTRRRCPEEPFVVGQGR